jgi:hypothetical protein
LIRDSRSHRSIIVDYQDDGTIGTLIWHRSDPGIIAAGHDLGEVQSSSDKIELSGSRAVQA